MGNNHSHALNDISNNKKNLCLLFMAVLPTGPLAIAFADIYILLNQLAPGQTVKDYCQVILGYNSKKYRDVFNKDERDLLSGPWDPKLLDVSFLYKLLNHVCDLSPDGQNWIDPRYELEFCLQSAKNVRNDTMHGRSELTDEELNNILHDLEHDVSTALRLAGEKKGRDVYIQDDTFKSKLQNFKPKKNLFRVVADSLRITAGSVGIGFGFLGSASKSVGTAPAPGVPMAAGADDFGSFGAASAGGFGSFGAASAGGFGSFGAESAGGFGSFGAASAGEFESFGAASADGFGSFGAASAGGFGHHTSETNEQIGREELMKFLNEAEASEFYGISAIIRRQLDLLER